MDKNNLKKKKTPYQKPELRIIDLAADEVLTIGCKSAGTIAADSNAQPGCFNSGCSGLDGS